ncbi:MAG: periplasmic heavy metal sensor [Burkholderiaceae bacterium]|nr:periplasmic heavy metal sensor [Burkholderiaceae bacterium]
MSMAKGIRRTIVATAVAAAALGATTLAAQPAGPGFGPGLFGGPGGFMAEEGRPGHGARHHHYHHRHGEMRGRGFSAERMGERIDRMAYRLVRSVDGTPEQEIKIREIARTAAKEVAELRKQGRELRKQGMDLLKAPSIDRAAIESLRGQQMALQDSISKRMSTAFADAAEVLTPEQRVKLAERAEQRGKRGQRGPREQREQRPQRG